MNKMIAVVAVAGLALVTFGEVAAPVKAAAPTKDGKARVQLTPEEKAARKARRKAEFYKQTGGHVKDLRKQKGKVVFVDAQSRAKRAWFADSAAWLGEKTKIVMAVEEGKFDLANVEKKGDYTVFIIDDAKLPSLLVAPEQKWAMMNIAPLYSDKEPFFEARSRKELTRTFSMLCGASMSNYPNPLFYPTGKAEDLDKVADWHLPVDILSKCGKYLEMSGVIPYRLTYYRTAVEEGWGANPTNDVEKAIWDEVHALPDKPMQIKFDPKRDK